MITTAIRNVGRSYLQIIKHMVARPASFALALTASFIGLGIVIWLPNMQFLGIVFGSSEIDIIRQTTFLLDTYHIVFRTLGTLQIISFVAYALLFGLTTVLVAAAIRLHSQSRLDEQMHLGLFMTLSGCGLSAIGNSLVTPIITTAGLSVNSTLYIWGTVISVAGIIVGLRGVHKIGQSLAKIKQQ